MTTRRGDLGPALLLVLVLVTWALVTAPGAGARESDAPAIAAGLAVVDSLLGAAPEEALAQVQRLESQYGEDPLYGWQIRGRLAVALMATERHAQALPHLEYLVRHDPTDPVWHRNLATTLRVLGKRGRALTEYGLVVELAPADYRARLEYGQYLLDFRNYTLAGHHLQEASRLCGGCEEAQRALVNLFLARGDFSSAVDPLLALAATDTSATIRRSLLAALSRSGRDEELLAYLEDEGLPNLTQQELRLVVDAEGNLGRSGHSRDFAFGLSGEPGESRDLPRLPDDPGFWGRVALNLLATGHFSEGLLAVDRAITLDPEAVTHRNNRVVLLQRLGRDAEAKQEWEEVLRLDPTLEQEQSP